MNTINRNGGSPNFRGFYMVEGPTAALGDFCAHLRRNLNSGTKFSDSMDFLDIRLSPEERTRVQKRFAPPNIVVKPPDDDKNYYILQNNRFHRMVRTGLENAKDLAHLVVSLIDTKEWQEKAKHQEIKHPFALDLIITKEDKKPVEKVLDKMLEESLPHRISELENQRIEGEALGDLRRNTNKGFPITNLRGNIVRQFLPLQFLDVPVIQVQEALQACKKGAFDIITGKFKQN